jgi:hypothetical protein
LFGFDGFFNLFFNFLNNFLFFGWSSYFCCGLCLFCNLLFSHFYELLFNYCKDINKFNKGGNVFQIKLKIQILFLGFKRDYYNTKMKIIPILTNLLQKFWFFDIIILVVSFLFWDILKQSINNLLKILSMYIANHWEYFIKIVNFSLEYWNNYLIVVQSFNNIKKRNLNLLLNLRKNPQVLIVIKELTWRKLQFQIQIAKRLQRPFNPIHPNLP